MQGTRQQILEILKRYGDVTVQELSQELNLTSVTVRHHLEILRSGGYITEPEVRRSCRPGRPRYVYRLTSIAADLFPNNYSGLANALLDVLEARIPPEEYETWWEETARRMVVGMGRLPESRDARMSNALRFLRQRGFVVRWEKNENGKYFIFVSSCPYHYVAQSHSATCRIDERMIQLLTGAEIVRTQGYAHQGTLCVYELEWQSVVA